MKLLCDMHSTQGNCSSFSREKLTLLTPRTMSVFASQEIQTLLAKRHIASEAGVLDAQIQPASLDLRLGHVAYRVRASFLVGANRRVADRLAEFEMHRMSLTDGAVLERGCVYVVPLQETLALPPDIEASCNAKVRRSRCCFVLTDARSKSSTGRLDLLTRTIIDGGVEFDRIPPGYVGPLFRVDQIRRQSVEAQRRRRRTSVTVGQQNANNVLSDKTIGTRNNKCELLGSRRRRSHLVVKFLFHNNDKSRR